MFTNGSSSGNNSNNSNSILPTEREQLLWTVRRLLTEADEFFVQQHEQLKASYGDLTQQLDQLRYRVQCGLLTPQPPPPALSHSHNLTPTGNATPYSVSAPASGVGVPGNGVSGGGQGISGTLDITPLRPPNFQMTTSALLSGMNHPHQQLALGGSLNDAHLTLNGTATPPSKHLALDSDHRSPSLPQPDDWATHPLASLAHDSIMASPQAAGKLSLEELLSRITNQESSPPPNLESIYNQLTGGDREGETPLGSVQREQAFNGVIGTPNGSRSPSKGSTAAGLQPPGIPSTHASHDKDVIPIDNLRSLHEQHLTTSVHAVYEHGRPTVVSVPDGKPEHPPESLGISVSSSCEVLVEFKRRRILQYDSTVYVAPGKYVVVGGDRGEDIGLVIYTWCEAVKSSAESNGKATRTSVMGIGLTGSMLPRNIGVGNGTVLRFASESDVQQLHTTQAELERRAIDVCAQRVLEHALPMVIVDAEYQFDKKKLTFFYEAQQRMDFRELVRDLYKTFRARIWMEVVDL